MTDKTAPALDEAALSAATRAVWDNYGTGRAPTADELDSCRADADVAITAYRAAQRPAAPVETDPVEAMERHVGIDPPRKRSSRIAALEAVLRDLPANIRAIVPVANINTVERMNEYGLALELQDACIATIERVALTVDGIVSTALARLDGAQETKP